MNLLARVSEEPRGDLTVVTVEGEVDASNASELGGRLRAALTNRSMALVVDLAATTYLDSAGINLLYAVGSELRARQQELHLVVVPGSPIERTLAIVGANRAFPVHANRDEALAT